MINNINMANMKFIILALFSLTLAARTETAVKDQKDENSAPRGKVLSPLYYHLSQKHDEALYARNEGGLGRLEGITVYGNRYSGNDEHLLRNLERYGGVTGEQYRNEGQEGGYSRNEGLLRNLGGYSTNEGGNLRDESLLLGRYGGNKGEYSRNEGLSRYVQGYNNDEENSRLEDRSRSLDGQLYKYKANDAENIRARNYGGKYYNEILQKSISMPVNIGDVGVVNEDRNKIYYYRLTGRTGLGFDKRTGNTYGMLAPITSSLLQVVGRHYPRNSVIEYRDHPEEQYNRDKEFEDLRVN